VPDIDDDRVLACADLVGRSGGRSFEVGYLNDATDLAYLTDGPCWYAQAAYNGARVIAEGHATPADACDALAIKVLDGGQCTHCGKTIAACRTATDVPGYCAQWRDGLTWKRACK